MAPKTIAPQRRILFCISCDKRVTHIGSVCLLCSMRQAGAIDPQATAQDMHKVAYLNARFKA